jgi:hypothetical protein
MFTTAFALLVTLSPAADPEKPISLKDDELAVLADYKSPDHPTVLERYDDKVLKLTGRVHYSGGGAVGAATARAFYYLEIPGKAKGDPALKVELAWSDDPEAKKSRDRAREARTAPTMTVYGRAVFHAVEGGRKIWSNHGLKDVTLDPKTGGVPYAPKERPPARLKDK